MIAKYAWDPFRLWELRAEYPKHDPADLASSIERLIRAEVLVCYAADDEAGPPLSVEDAIAYTADSSQWLNLEQNPWPARGRIYEFLLTDQGRRSLPPVG
jgi:hypothetical protein